MSRWVKRTKGIVIHRFHKNISLNKRKQDMFSADYSNLHHWLMQDYYKDDRFDDYYMDCKGGTEDFNKMNNVFTDWEDEWILVDD